MKPVLFVADVGAESPDTPSQLMVTGDFIGSPLGVYGWPPRLCLGSGFDSISSDLTLGLNVTFHELFAPLSGRRDSELVKWYAQNVKLWYLTMVRCGVLKTVKFSPKNFDSHSSNGSTEIFFMPKIEDYPISTASWFLILYDRTSQSTGTSVLKQALIHCCAGVGV